MTTPHTATPNITTHTAVLTAATPAGEDALKFGKPSKKVKLLMTLAYDVDAIEGENGGWPSHRKQVVEWFVFIASSEDTGTSEFITFVDEVLMAKAIAETMRTTDTDVTDITWALESALEGASGNTAEATHLLNPPLDT